MDGIALTAADLLGVYIGHEAGISGESSDHVQLLLRAAGILVDRTCLRGTGCLEVRRNGGALIRRGPERKLKLRDKRSANVTVDARGFP